MGMGLHYLVIVFAGLLLGGKQIKLFLQDLQPHFYIKA